MWRHLRRGCLEQRWVDYAINDGKSEGAFSYGTYDSHPFIMMSFDGNLSSMGTLAHELGHSMHSHYYPRASAIRLQPLFHVCCRGRVQL